MILVFWKLNGNCMWWVLRLRGLDIDFMVHHVELPCIDVPWFDRFPHKGSLGVATRSAWPGLKCDWFIRFIWKLYQCHVNIHTIPPPVTEIKGNLSWFKVNYFKFDKKEYILYFTSSALATHHINFIRAYIRPPALCSFHSM